MADFKDEISAALARRLARELTAAWLAFPGRRFTRGVDEALAPLALMARVELLTDRLADALPDDFDEATQVLWRALESPDFTGWMTLPRVAIGEAVSLTLAIELDEGEPADAVIDYRVHYVGAKGLRAPKVFKLTRRRLQPGQPITVTRKHRFEHVSIRRILGRHVIDIQVNGRVLGRVDVDVVDG